MLLLKIYMSIENVRFSELAFLNVYIATPCIYANNGLFQIIINHILNSSNHKLRPVAEAKQ